MSALHGIGMAMHRLNYNHTRKQSILSYMSVSIPRHAVIKQHNENYTSF